MRMESARICRTRCAGHFIPLHPDRVNTTGQRASSGERRVVERRSKQSGKMVEVINQRDIRSNPVKGMRAGVMAKFTRTQHRLQRDGLSTNLARSSRAWSRWHMSEQVFVFCWKPAASDLSCRETEASGSVNAST